MTITRDSQARQQTIIIAFLSFIGLGLTGGLLGLAWPPMQKQFGLALDSVNTLFLVQTVAYTVASFTIGRLLARLGSGLTLLLGTTLMTVCLFGIAAAPSWEVVIGFSMIFGLGSGILDACLNVYVAAYHSAQQMSWLHASFGVGVTVGPLIMTFVLSHALGWQVGYAVTGVVLLIVVGFFAVSRKEWRNEGFQNAENKPVLTASFGQSLRVPAIWLSVATYFVYVGLEVGIGQWAGTLLTESRGMSLNDAGPWVSIYWGAFTGGRIVFGLFANRFEISRVLQTCMVGIIVGTVLFFWNPVTFLGVNTVGLLSLIIIGFAQAPIFPMFMAGTAQRVGPEHAQNAISLQMGGVGIGTAILPGLIGTIGKNYGLEAMALVFVVLSVFVFVLHELLRTRARSAEMAALSTAGD